MTTLSAWAQADTGSSVELSTSAHSRSLAAQPVQEAAKARNQRHVRASVPALDRLPAVPVDSRRMLAVMDPSRQEFRQPDRRRLPFDALLDEQSRPYTDLGLAVHDRAVDQLVTRLHADGYPVARDELLSATRPLNRPTRHPRPTPGGYPTRLKRSATAWWPDQTVSGEVALRAQRGVHAPRASVEGMDGRSRTGRATGMRGPSSPRADESSWCEWHSAPVEDLSDTDMIIIREALGDLFGELIQVMLDLGTPPIFLDSDDRPRIADLRERAKVVLDRWAAAEPKIASVVVDGIPEVLRGPIISESLLVAAVWTAYFDLPPRVFLPPTLDSRVFAAVPRLAARLDDDGLLDVSGLDARPHGLFVDGYSLHYHQLLRRGYHSNVHYGLIGSLLDLPRRHEVTVRLAIDDRRIRFEHEHEELEERDYWFGRLLTEEFLDDLAAVGETFYGDPDGGRSFVHPYAGLSARWTSDGSLRTLEVEEFMPVSPGTSKFVLARYLHAIRDTSKRTFIHCDGAVKVYDRESYPHSQATFRDRGKGLHYRKLFRIDGALPTDAWSHVLTAWFRGNRLVLEYLDGLSAEMSN